MQDAQLYSLYTVGTYNYKQDMHYSYQGTVINTTTELPSHSHGQTFFRLLLYISTEGSQLLQYGLFLPKLNYTMMSSITCTLHKTLLV
jgi:hypothetical protein